MSLIHSYLSAVMFDCGPDHQRLMDDRCGVISDLSLHSFDQVIADTQRVRDDRKRRIHRAAGAEEAAVDDVKIIDVVGSAMHVERRRCRGSLPKRMVPI